jgi:hypothetical protein
MLKPILLVCTCVFWLVLAVASPATAADVQRAGDPPPMLTGTDTAKLVGSAALAVLGLGLVVWSLRPQRQVSRPARDRATPSSARADA